MWLPRLLQRLRVFAVHENPHPPRREYVTRTSRSAGIEVEKSMSVAAKTNARHDEARTADDKTAVTTRE